MINAHCFSDDVTYYNLILNIRKSSLTRRNDMSLIQIALLGGIIGVPLGYAMQRTHLCFNRAYRHLILLRDTILIRAIFLAILVQMVGLTLLVQFNVGGVGVNVVPFYWLAAMVGGFIFGISMVYAEGCSSTVWYRVGNGNMAALIALVGFALGEAAIRFGPLSEVGRVLQSFEIKLESSAPATLPNLLGVNPWYVVLPVVLLGGWSLVRSKGGSYEGGWDWRIAGLVLGVIGTLAWVAAWPTGWHYGVGVVGSTAQYVLAVTEGPRVLNWGSFVVLSMPIGAFVAAYRKKELRLRVPDLRSSIRYLIAGGAMGISAAIAGGCNIGHGFSGLPTLAVSSLLATLFTFLGAWLGNYLRYMRIQAPRITGLEENAE
jgi:hypothetical protein